MVLTVDIRIPHERLMKDEYMDDDYLLNQMDGVNDNPEEDGLPLRKWLLRETRAAIDKDHKMREVVLRPKADKGNRTQFAMHVYE